MLKCCKWGAIIGFVFGVAVMLIWGPYRGFIDFMKLCFKEALVGVWFGVGFYFQLEKEKMWKKDRQNWYNKRRESALKQGDVKPVAVPVPVELEHGKYYISIKEIQDNHAGISSKQVLQPLLRQGKFYSLEIVCKYLPPWLEGDLMQGGLDGTIVKGEGEVTVLITRKTCNG